MGMSGQDTPGILRAGLRRLKNATRVNISKWKDRIVTPAEGIG
jgi:hypothetical protein